MAIRASDQISIGSLQLKNRIVLAPMGTTTDHTFGFNQRDVDYYGERAKGGCGLVLAGAVTCSDEFEPAPCQKLVSVKDAYNLHLVAERVHHYGAEFGIQLSPGIGRITICTRGFSTRDWSASRSAIMSDPARL